MLVCANGGLDEFAILDGVPCYRELAGQRVLITNLSPVAGVDVAIAFANQRCRMVLDVPQPGPEMDAVAEFVAERALDARVFHEEIAEGDVDAVVAFTRKAAQIYGGLDIVLNIVPLQLDEIGRASTLQDIETLITARFQHAARASTVAANRMRLMMCQGLILNVLAMSEPRSASQAAVAGIARTAFAVMIRREAEAAVRDGIRINGVAARARLTLGRGLPSSRVSEARLAEIALHVASEEGAGLTGLVFDAEAV